MKSLDKETKKSKKTNKKKKKKEGDENEPTENEENNEESGDEESGEDEDQNDGDYEQENDEDEDAGENAVDENGVEIEVKHQKITALNKIYLIYNNKIHRKSTRRNVERPQLANDDRRRQRRTIRCRTAKMKRWTHR